MKHDKKSIQNKLTNVKYNCDEQSHLIVKQEVCKKCKDKTCLYICPADVYELNNENKEIIVKYENCLECGACKIACPKNNIDWKYPSSGHGVVYKNS